MIWLYLTSGLFLGWSLGANDAANIFGAAVSTKMVRFTTAAIVASIFIILGAVFGGAGTTHTLGVLGDVNAIAGSFTVALAAALTVFLLIRRSLPVSVSQAIVGAILGWNLFTSSPTDINSLVNIVISWIVNPLLACALSFSIYYLLRAYIKKSNMHILRLDRYTRIAFLIVAGFGAYALGANNIAKVVGVFITSSPFQDVKIFGVTITGVEQLFFAGACSMAVGIITYSNKTISTIGTKIYKLTPLSALSSVLAASVVLFLFSSTTLEKLLSSVGLPAFPLVPVSITQAMVGAILGIGFAKGGRYINYQILGKIGMGWLITPIAAGIISFVSLFIVQNVFQAKVYDPLTFEISVPVLTEIEKTGVPAIRLKPLENKVFENQSELRQSLNKIGVDREDDIFKIFHAAKIENFRIDSNYAKERLNPNQFTSGEIDAIKRMHNETFRHRWQIWDRLRLLSYDFSLMPDTPQGEYHNKRLQEKLEIIYTLFKIR